MAQYKSAIKSHKQSLKRALRNKIIKTKIKTHIKKVESKINSTNLSQAQYALRIAESIIMKAVTKKILKLNTASRKISRLTHKVKALESL
jgi:small subunit ribosomal protein S20